MRFIIRYFFRFLRLVLTPFMLVGEKLSTPKGIERTSQQQEEVDKECEKLALYQFKTCPFCIKVRKQMARLSLPIEVRDAQNNQQRRTELEQGGGRIKVPCLRIEKDDGSSEWMYESDDINQYLQQRFG
ncbi:glutaredoxin family protein [Idiomarina seosinensis]|uniref:Glutaredoxin n=1 Tax=Idiomarina seosinensis TaxID=281739 RepID=A0A432ZJL8_9GAMM|nr:glutathione S-transferase N-terminal domain-containing protein [Idiomarina seosinensis]RUO78129.1 glutaredoxin [Idiomarina seosinensis]